MKVDLLIPCYNEDKNINYLVDEWRDITNINKNIYVLFIDNGSTDQTNKILKNKILTINSPNLDMLEIKKNIGYGSGLKLGFQHTVNEIVGWTHADLQIPTEDVAKAINFYLKNQNSDKVVLKGRRKERNILDNFFTFFMSIVGYFFTKELIYDINAQPKLFYRNIIKDINTFPDNFLIDAELLYLAKKKGVEIIEYESEFLDRKFNNAKGGGTLKGKLNLSINTLRYFWKFRKINHR